MKAISRFIGSDVSGGVVLFLAAVAALVTANSGIADGYRAGLGAPLLGGTVLFWINDLLMAFFFLLAGMEIKRECLAGALASRARAGLPLIAAVCGMIVPALVYLFVTRDFPAYHHGWAISSATDIAFALGVLALAGPRLPPSVRALLLAIAVMDDLGAILVIALFYTGAIALPALGVAGLAVGGLIALNRGKVMVMWPYFLVGAVLWTALLKAGIHPTVGGVILGFSIPMMDRARGYSPLEALEHGLKPWVVFGVLPVFAFANAGVSLAGLSWGALLHPVTLAIGLGLFIGKQAGIFGSLYLAVKTPWFLMPAGATWSQLYGMSLLCGIGFTMALFIGGLAFPGGGLDAYVRLGVLGGSLLSAVLGYVVLLYSAKTPWKDSYE